MGSLRDQLEGRKMNSNNFRYKTDKEGLVVMGDIHCDWTQISNFCKLVSDYCIVQLGDFGLGFIHPIKEYHQLKKLNKQLHESNNELIVIRGNHDNPSRFLGKWVTDEILLADDYHILNYKDKSIQLIGGGISIDRSERVIGRSWWPREEVKFNPERVENVDYLFTHCAPTNAGLDKADTNTMVAHFHQVEQLQGGDLLRDLKIEQGFMQQISDLSECKKHIFGHYHVNHIYNDPRNGREYICVPINGLREIK